MSQKDTKHDSTTQSIALARSDWKQFDADDDAGAARHNQVDSQSQFSVSFSVSEREIKHKSISSPKPKEVSWRARSNGRPNPAEQLNRKCIVKMKFEVFQLPEHTAVPRPDDSLKNEKWKLENKRPTLASGRARRASARRPDKQAFKLQSADRALHKQDNSHQIVWMKRREKKTTPKQKKKKYP